MSPPPVVVRCGKCQQRMQIVPMATDSQITCVGCGTVLRIAGTSEMAAVSVPIPRPLTNRATRPANFATTPQPRPATPVARLPKSKKGIPKWVFIAVGVVVLVPIVCCGALGLVVSMRANSGKPVPIAVSVKAALPPHQFPQLGTPERTYPSGVRSYFVEIASHPTLPGHRMQMRILLPPGEHAERSLPCVLIAPAGTPMLHGVSLEKNDPYDAETLPYVEAGFVVIQYSLDGSLPAGAENADEDSMSGFIGKAYPEFKASGAGVVNGRNAIEFALYSLKMVDPQQISCAGHSSAANVSLLLAAHDHRIHRCIAYAAAYDLESRMGEMASNIVVRTVFPGIKEFIIETSPKNHIATIECPVLIFHARNDSNVPFSDAEAFVAQMKSAGKDVTFETTPTGEHYESMIDPGIPTAITWLKTN